MIDCVDVQKPVPEIVAVLHKYQIPIALVDQVFDIIKTFHKRGTTVLLVEQNAGKSLAISDRAYVLENGKIALSGTGAELMQSEDVKKAYLGG